MWFSEMGSSAGHPKGHTELWLLKPSGRDTSGESDHWPNSSPCSHSFFFFSCACSLIWAQQTEGPFKIRNQIRSLPCLKLFSGISLHTWGCHRIKSRNLTVALREMMMPPSSLHSPLPSRSSKQAGLLSVSAAHQIHFLLGVLGLASAQNALPWTLMRIFHL